MIRKTINDWQGKDPSDCSTSTVDDKTSDKQFFIGIIILFIVFITMILSCHYL